MTHIIPAKQPFILLFLLLALPVKLLAQQTKSNYFARHYLVQERLAEGLVFDILQDDQGFMWFATEFGLIRYDGHDQKIYQYEPSNPNSLAGNEITCLAEDAAGNLWVGTMFSGLYYFDRRTERFIPYQYDAADDQSIGNNKIREILVTEDGSVWVSTEGGGVQLFDQETGKFTRLMWSDVDWWSTDGLLEDRRGQLWVGGYFGLNLWDATDSSFSRKALVQELDPNSNTLKTLAEDESGRIWAGFRNGGLAYFEPGTNEFRPVRSEPKWPQRLEDNHIWDIDVDQEGNLWIATDGFLFYLDQKDQEEIPRLSKYDLTTESRYLSICKSEDGVMWIGTNDGVVVLTPRHKEFLHFQARKPGELEAKKRGITSISSNRDDQLWVGTIDGLFQFDQLEQHFHQSFLGYHPLLGSFEDSNIAALYLDNGNNLWIATIEGFDQGFGLFCYQMTEKRLTNFSERNESFRAYPTNHIVEDGFGHLWFANDNGLLRYDPTADRVRPFKHDPENIYSLGGNRINRVFFSSSNDLWIGTDDAGLVRYDFDRDRFQAFEFQLEDSTMVVSRRIMSIYEDRDQQLWLGTAGGLVRFDPQTEAVELFDSRKGLASNLVRGVLQDRDGIIWLNCQTSIARFDPEQGVFTNFQKYDGVLIKEFWSGCYAAPNGELYFGGYEGLLVFHPDKIRNNSYAPPVVFTDFLLFNQEVVAGPENEVMPVPIHLNPTITLHHDQNVFTIGFAGLSYINPQNTHYSTKMENFEENWQDLGRKTEVTYTNLDPGTYFFRVKATNSDGVYDKEGGALKILVLPPWYQTWWAYLLYALMAGGSIYVIYYFQLNRRLAQAEAVRLRELDAVKTQLYTNITHEFRTPLTLIQGPVERAIEDSSYALEKRDLDLIRRNCHRLLNLIRQMLDMNKLEASALDAVYSYGDVIPALKYIVDAFSSFADGQGVEVMIETPDFEIPMDYDQEKLFDIVSNLVSNAVKFTPSGGRVMVRVNKFEESGKETLEVSVQDSGVGIPSEELDKVFDRFYRVGQIITENQEETTVGGTGIGLALAMRLARLLEGNISAHSEEGRGSVFILQLPIRHQKQGKADAGAFPDLYIPQPGEKIFNYASEQVEGTRSDGPTLLIVEDNADVARFIFESIPAYFQKIIATNGKEGLDLALEYIPDLIISDVLMPQADGYFLTGRVRADHRTSHIPIILLTAKADDDSRIEGYEKGADAYLTKPFNSQELLIRIEQLLESRRRLQSYYLQKSGLSETNQEANGPRRKEHEFLQETRQLIENHLEQGHYSIESLAQDLHMSPSQLYRKIMALTGQSPSKFFRNIQITRAKELLAHSELSISDIAYRTGFNDPAYFTRVFTAEAGQPPSSYRGDIGN